MEHRATEVFWRAYEALPVGTRAFATRPTIRELVAINAFTRTYAIVSLQALDQRSGGPLKLWVGEARAQLCRAAPFASLALMPPPVPEELSRTIETLYRSESGRVLATLVRLLGDLDLAEEAMHEAFAAALESWPRTGIPDKPRPWLISTARFKAIDKMRRRARFDGETQKDFALYMEARINEPALDDEEIEDDRLRLIFTCCHPALPPEGQVALTLREICGLTTEEIARAFLVTPATLAQRIVRAKAVIHDKAIPYQVPASQELPARLGAVLLVVYLIFNEGFSAETTGAELSREAIRLGRLLLGLLPEPEVMGLLGLMLLHESRRAARTSGDGDLILLEQQDRSLWGREQIAEGISLTESALRSRRFGAYTLQAAIAAVHAESSSVASTDWRQIALLYDQLLRIQPSPVVELNRAVAIAMCEGLEQGLRLIDELLAREQLSGYHLAHSARADMCRRLGRIPEARASYEKALALASQEPDRRFLARRLEELK
jgi:RNA polymerase sigma-70 factor (ECF subfamily)